MASNAPKSKRDDKGGGGEGNRKGGKEGSVRQSDAKGAGKSADPPMKSGGGGRRGKR